MGYTEIKELTEAVQKLNVAMDDRIKTVESWKAKWEAKFVEGEAYPSEAKEGLDTINKEISAKIAEYRDLVAQHKEIQLASQRPSIYTGAYAGETGTQKSDATKAFIKFCRYKGDVNRVPMEERKHIDPSYMDRANMPDELKVMVSAVADLGGFFAGTDFSSRFIQKLFLISEFRALADVQTIGGEKLVLVSEGTTDTDVTWSDEQTAHTEQANANTGLIEIFARELDGMQKISNQNIEDAAWDIEGFLLKRLTRKFAQKEGASFISGDGVARPEGVLTNTAINSFTSVTAGAILPEDIIQVMHKGKSGYRKTSTWCMSNNTIGVLRLFKDSQNRPLWQMFGEDFKETLFGRPIVEMPDMVDPTTGTVTYTTGQAPILFGDFSQGYQIVDRVGLAFQVLKELFAVQKQIAYMARMRVGGKVVLPEAITKLVIQ